MRLPWPIKKSLMELVCWETKNRILILLDLSMVLRKSWVSLYEKNFVWVCCKTILEDKVVNIKDLVVALPSYFINTKVFPFPKFDLCGYQLNIVGFLDRYHRLLICFVIFILFALFSWFFFRCIVDHMESSGIRTKACRSEVWQ